MGEFLQRIRDQITEFYQGLDRNRRIFVIGGSVAIVLIMTIAILLLTRTTYVVLQQDLSAQQAGLITAQLDSLGIQYNVENNSSTVLVPEGDLSRAQMGLAVSGVVGETGITYQDLVQNQSITMNNDTMEMMRIRADINNLETTLKALNGVNNAIVNLYVPSESAYFVTDDQPSKANVVLVLNPGYEMSQAQIDGIVAILTGAVKGLTEENVSIVDANARPLTRTGERDDAYNANTQMELKHSVESSLEADLMDFLQTLYGSGNVQVMASVKLNFDSEESVSTVFSPPVEGEPEGLIRSASEITENVKNASESGGAPGTDTNTEATNYTEAGSAGTNYEKASKTLNYELNEIVTKIVKEKGNVEDITIAIALNTDALVDNTLTPEHKSDLIDLVSASAGLDTKVVEVSAMQFPDPLAGLELVTDPGTLVLGLPIMTVAIIAIVLLLIIIGVVVYLRRTARIRREREEEEKRRLEQEQAELEEIKTMEDRSSPKYQIEKFIDTNIEAVASLLRAWMNED